MQKQRSNKDAPLTGKTVQGNPDAASAVRKAKDALAAIDVKPVSEKMTYCRDGEQRAAYRHKHGGMICCCFVEDCMQGPFVWRN